MTTDQAVFAITPGLKHHFTGAQLAMLGQTIGADADVELTTVQQLIVRMPAEQAEAAHAKLEAAGLRIYPVGTVTKNLRTCSFCKGDEEEGFAAALSLDAAVAGMPTPFPLRIAYSGCPNGCAEPLVQDIGVVKMPEGYAVYVGGRAQGLNPGPGVLLAGGLSEAELPQVVTRLIKLYQDEGTKRERFGRFIERLGAEVITARVLTQA